MADKILTVGIPAYKAQDHINDCFRSKTPTPYFMNNYQRYKTIHNLKKDYKFTSDFY